MWTSRVSLFALVGAQLALTSLAGCKADRCRSFTPALELQVTAPPALGANARQLAVTLTIDGARRSERFALGDALSDGLTSLAIALDGVAAGADVALSAEVELADEGGVALARGQASLSGRGDACNVLRVSAVASAGDASVLDAFATELGATEDASPADGGVAADTGVAADVEPTDTGVPADTGVPPDMGAPADMGVTPDTGVPPDTGVRADSGVAPDSGVSPPFTYRPRGLDPATITPGGELVLDCGRAVELDTTTGAWSNACPGAPTVRSTTLDDGTPIALIAVTRFLLGASSTLELRGERPLYVLVYGDATLGGRVLTVAKGADPAPGGRRCGPMGSPEGAGRAGGGGGGFGEPGGAGGAGGDGSPGPSGGVTANLPSLVGGCAGGDTRGAAGGGGGGAFAVASAGTLTLRGSIAATGGGGEGGPTRVGGAGGGSGGSVWLEAATLRLEAGSLVDTRGGGGGGGGDHGNGDGDDGDDGDTNGLPLGGRGSGSGGVGGSGSTGATGAFAGFPGQSLGTGGGGGGGGGGAGIVWLSGHPSCTRLGETRPLLAPCR